MLMGWGVREVVHQGVLHLEGRFGQGTMWNVQETPVKNEGFQLKCVEGGGIFINFEVC